MNDHATQPDMFQPAAPMVNVTVTYHGRGGYRAAIDGGWWYAWGKKKQDAINSVLKLYETEKNKCH